MIPNSIDPYFKILKLGTNEVCILIFFPKVQFRFFFPKDLLLKKMFFFPKTFCVIFLSSKSFEKKKVNREKPSMRNWTLLWYKKNKSNKKVSVFL